MKSFNTLFLASVAAIVLNVSAFAADPSGSWKWNMTNPNGESSESTLTLEMKEGKLMGTVKGRRGETPISDATFTDDRIKFSVVRQRDDQKWVMKYEGKLEADSIKGTIEIPNRDGGDPRKVEWNAHKA